MYLVTELFDDINSNGSKFCIVTTLDEAWKMVREWVINMFLNGVKEYGTLEEVLALVKEQEGYDIDHDEEGVNVFDEGDLQEYRRSITEVKPTHWTSL